MKSYILQTESDVRLIQELIARLPGPSTVVDFEESIQLSSVRATTRLWKQGGQIIGFAFVDDFNNLRFEIEREYRSTQLEKDVIDWGIVCVKKRNAETGEEKTLDASFSGTDTWQIAMLERTGFVRESVRTLHYARSLNEPVASFGFPQGFSLRCVKGEQEVEDLVVLHRAAFGTQNMSVEARLAIMRAPQYERELDFVAVAPNGEFSAFCICGFKDEKGHNGFTDPIGVHPRYQKIGLGKAIVTAGIKALKNKGARIVELGTSSENSALQRLAARLGFVITSQSLWFSKKIT
jgi:ribosomal protein S18 acetylase RimI-like enzyme